MGNGTLACHHQVLVSKYRPENWLRIRDSPKCRHVRTHFELADALTKSMEPDLIIEVLSTGKVMLQGDAPKKVTSVTKHETTSLVCQFRRARKQRKKELKMLKMWK